jgi:hypothetical protein
MANTRLGSTNVFASLPFDQIDGVAGFFVHEDFEAVSIVGDVTDFNDGTGKVITTLGASDWFGHEISGAAVSNITNPTVVADHPGIIRLEVGATSPANGDACALQYGPETVAIQNTYLPDDNGMYIATVVRISNVDAQVIEFGFVGQTPEIPSAGALDTCGLVFDPEDTANVGDKWFEAQLNDANTDVVDMMSNVNYVENDWVLLEIALTNTGASYRVTTEDATETTSLSGTITVAMRPSYSVENVTTIEAVLDIDLFHLRYLRRDALVGTGSDWLGA